MRTRLARLLIPLLAVAAACQKHSAPAATPPPTPVAPTSAPGAQAGASGSGSAATPAADPWAATTARKDPISHPLLWAIEKDGTTTYAFGTMHQGVDPETKLPQIVWDKLDAAKTFAMETDLSDTSLAAELITRKDGKTLHGELGNSYWQKLEAALTPDVAGSLDHATPAVAATLVSMRGLPTTAAMDGVMVAHAQNRGEKILYLEPAEKQVHLLIKWMDVWVLEEMLDDFTEFVQQQKDLLAAYLAGDDNKMIELSDAERVDWKKAGRSDAEYDRMMEDMLYQRNASWIDEIEQMHAQGGGFIAVGAMHLIGKRSVLELLAKRGYKVTRLSP
jgi:uncharacterized protein YbaP (TraB family)